MADERAPVATPVTDAPETAAPDDLSLADHQSVFGPPDPSLEGEAKAKNDEARAHVRHRAKSQEAGPEDVGRIGELTKKLRATEAERDALKATRPPPTPPAPLPVAAAARVLPVGPERGDSGHRPLSQPSSVTPTRPKPSEEAVGTTYQTYADFVEDLSDWKAEQRIAALEIDQRIQHRLAQDRATQTFTAQVEATRAKGRTAYPDFDEMLTSGPGTFVDMPVPAVQAILQHPQSEHLQYQVMKDGALAQRLAGLAFTDPYTFAFELAKLVPTESASPPALPPPLTLAARPPNPVRTGPAKIDADLADDDSMSLSEHEKAYGKRLRR